MKQKNMKDMVEQHEKAAYILPLPKWDNVQPKIPSFPIQPGSLLQSPTPTYIITPSVLKWSSMVMGLGWHLGVV